MAAAGFAAGVWPGTSARAADADDAIEFVLIGDTHYRADEMQPERLDRRSQEATSRLVGALNRLEGTPISAEAGGGAVGDLRGVIHAGDLIDTGDKNGRQHVAMQQTEWDAYRRDFGVVGGDGRMKFPVYEVHGNHDGPGGKGVAIDGIIERNKTRKGVTRVSPNGLHYAWDWGPVHFINLGIAVGTSAEAPQRKRRYKPMESYAFLVDDLKQSVGDSGRPVVITHHIDVARYTVPCDPAAPFDSKEWDPCDVAAYYHAIKPYNVAAVLYGHTHARNVFAWDGTPVRGQHGVRVFNTDESSHFHSPNHALLHFHITPTKLTAREYATKDNWQSAQWTPQVWSHELKPVKA